jgi:hypothetical protein
VRASSVFLLGLLLPTSSLADPDTVAKISGIYSSLRYVEETGDLVGLEIMVIPTGNHVEWNAVIQVAEGGSPSVAIVPLTALKDHFEFHMPADGPLAHIRCEVRFLAMGAELSGSSCFEEHSLKRTKSYWE